MSKDFTKPLKATIAAIIYGETHAPNVPRWDGTPKQKLFNLLYFNQENFSCFRNLNSVSLLRSF